jgi:catechol 2,3-dioxygenase-like lactoylglutathione lyase family enzyme
MVRTYGLTHISLAVRDLDAALRFYQAVFGVEVVYREGDSIQVVTPGAKDVIAFERVAAVDVKSGGVAHFGFRLIDPADIDRAVAEAERAGGRLVRRGEFAPGSPFAYVNDPDGYEIEIWFE